ncbi:MAG: M14 family zinc carboxypeptidase, partial [Sulfuritalea sp.]|nr:M14 family zinc carboxypeptidase [Sulfuritalea sp.]
MNTLSAHELAELNELEGIIAAGAPHLSARVVCEVTSDERRFPVYAISLGNPGLDVPAVGFFGGVHGLERIGAEVVLVYLRSLVARLRWDSVLHRELESVRLVFMPIVNPGGMWRGTRANPNGVDLMRNAPLESTERVPFMIGG